MIKTELSKEEAEKLAEKIARFSLKWNLPGTATFLFEMNRPIAPIVGHLLIGFGTMIDMLFPMEAQDLGLFLLEDSNTLLLEKKIKELASEQERNDK